MTGAVFQRSHQFNTDGRTINAQGMQLPCQLFLDAMSYVPLPIPGHQSQADAVRFMDYLVLPYIREAFQDVPKMDRMNGDLSPRPTLKVENIVIPPVDGKNTPEWLATRAWLRSQHHHIRYFVAYDGLSKAEETGKQNLVS